MVDSLDAWRASQSEAAFQAAVIEYAITHGWKWHHTPDSEANKKPPREMRKELRQACAGFPDLVLARAVPGADRGRIVVAELKREDGSASAAQFEWLDLFSALPGVEVHLWRPSSWAEIEEALA